MAAIYENPNTGNADEHVYSYCEPQLDSGTGVDVHVPVPVARGNNSVSTRIKNNVQCAALACHTVMILALLCISIFLLEMPKTEVLRQKDHHDQDYRDDNLTRNDHVHVVDRLTATEIEVSKLRNHLTIAETRIDQHTSEMAGIRSSLAQAETMILNLTTSLKDYVNGTNCPDAWVAFQGSCYYFETGNTRTFQESEDFCRTLGGHLAEVESIDENNFIKQQLQILQRGDFWFALIKRRGEWTWLNTNTAPTFSDWGAGEPNYQGTDQTCGQFYQTISFSWDDTECFMNNNRPLCEIRRRARTDAG